MEILPRSTIMLCDESRRHFAQLLAYQISLNAQWVIEYEMIPDGDDVMMPSETTVKLTGLNYKESESWKGIIAYMQASFPKNLGYELRPLGHSGLADLVFYFRPDNIGEL